MSLFEEKSDIQEHPKYQSILSIGEEVINPEELNNLLNHKPDIVAYDGFEPSEECICTRTSTCS